jgi:aminopeptidase N
MIMEYIGENEFQKWIQNLIKKYQFKNINIELLLNSLNDFNIINENNYYYKNIENNYENNENNYKNNYENNENKENKINNKNKEKYKKYKEKEEKYMNNSKKFNNWIYNDGYPIIHIRKINKEKKETKIIFKKEEEGNYMFTQKRFYLLKENDYDFFNKSLELWWIPLNIFDNNNNFYSFFINNFQTNFFINDNLLNWYKFKIKN